MSDVAQEIKVGDVAPDFTLKDQDQNDVTLSSFKGNKNVVLAFYPLDWSPVCEGENKCLTDDFCLNTLNYVLTPVSRCIYIVRQSGIFIRPFFFRVDDLNSGNNFRRCQRTTSYIALRGNAAVRRSACVTVFESFNCVQSISSTEHRDHWPSLCSSKMTKLRTFHLYKIA
jgi:hypothetical protein